MLTVLSQRGIAHNVVHHIQLMTLVIHSLPRKSHNVPYAAVCGHGLFIELSYEFSDCVVHHILTIMMTSSYHIRDTVCHVLQSMEILIVPPQRCHSVKRLSNYVVYLLLVTQYYTVTTAVAHNYHSRSVLYFIFFCL